MEKKRRWRDAEKSGRLLALLVLFTQLLINAQETVEKSISSKILGEDRRLFVHLPANYDDEGIYPVIIVLDGGYMFRPVAGDVDFYTRIDGMPPSIVVGVDQNYTDDEGIAARWVDCRYDDKTGLPVEKGALFFDFIRSELTDFLESNYSVSGFITIIGVSFTANYINYFLFDDDPVINGYAALSPFYAPNSRERFEAKLNSLNEHIFYYLCTGENDLEGHIPSINRMNTYLSGVESEYFHYDFDNFDNADHQTLVLHGVPRALELFFSKYDALKEGELELLPGNINLLDYIRAHYDLIEEIYGVRRRIREIDLRRASTVLNAGRKWEQLQELGELTTSLYPDLASGYYMLGTAAENRKEYEKALEFYKTGYSKLSDNRPDKSSYYDDITRMRMLINRQK